MSRKDKAQRQILEKLLNNTKRVEQRQEKDRESRLKAKVQKLMPKRPVDDKGFPVLPDPDDAA